MATTPSVDLKDIRPLTDSLRNTKTHVARIKRSKAPVVFTVNGSASIVVQDATTYQKLLDRLDELEERERLSPPYASVSKMWSRAASTLRAMS